MGLVLGVYTCLGMDFINYTSNTIKNFSIYSRNTTTLNRQLEILKKELSLWMKYKPINSISHMAKQARIDTLKDQISKFYTYEAPIHINSDHRPSISSSDTCSSSTSDG